MHANKRVYPATRRLKLCPWKVPVILKMYRREKGKLKKLMEILGKTVWVLGVSIKIPCALGDVRNTIYQRGAC